MQLSQSLVLIGIVFIVMVFGMWAKSGFWAILFGLKAKSEQDPNKKAEAVEWFRFYFYGPIIIAAGLIAIFLLLIRFSK
jgi:hypothetical protein